jgi:hypothetical protein
LLTVAAAPVIALFYRADTSQLWDILKLAMQGIGALVFARMTVVWAIDKFKSQKRWERDASTYAGTVAALREMKRVNDILWTELITGGRYNPDWRLTQPTAITKPITIISTAKGILFRRH